MPKYVKPQLTRKRVVPPQEIRKANQVAKALELLKQRKLFEASKLFMDTKQTRRIYSIARKLKAENPLEAAKYSLKIMEEAKERKGKALTMKGRSKVSEATEEFSYYLKLEKNMKELILDMMPEVEAKVKKRKDEIFLELLYTSVGATPVAEQLREERLKKDDERKKKK